MKEPSPTSDRRRPLPIHSMGAAAIVGLTVWLGVWLIGAVGEAREAARRTQCNGHFCQLKVALANYHDTYDSFPPAYVSGPDGKRWHSWRTLLLPFMDQQEVYEQYRFDEPWNGPHNRRLAETTRLRWLQCPSSPGYERTPFTNYVVVVGDGTLFPGHESVSVGDVVNPEQTILFVEAEGLDIHWTEPRDLELAAMSFDVNAPDAPSISSAHLTGAHAMQAGDGCNTLYLTTGSTKADIKDWLVMQTANKE